MQFAFDQEQLEFSAQLRAFADKECPPDALRQAWDQAPGWSATRWHQLAEMGVTGITVPDELGGLGLGFVELVLLLEEFGRSGMPEPLAETALGIDVLLHAGQRAAELAGEIVPAVVKGEASISVAGLEQSDLAVAGAGCVLAWHKGSLMALTPAGDTASVRSLDGARHLVHLDLDAGQVVVDGHEAEALRVRAFDLGALTSAAVLVGAGRRMIDIAAQYATERSQFGKAIGSFQAVKHHLASALVRVEFAKPLVYRAAWSLDQGDPEAGRHCSMAKAAASDAGTAAARVALQVHGAIGYTWEHDLHLWMKRAWSLASLWGDAGWHRSRLLGLVDW